MNQLNQLLLIYSIRVVLIFALLFASATFVIAQDDSEPEPEAVIEETIPDLAEPVEFVSGDSTLDNFLNNILNDIRTFLLLTVAPATGLIVVGRNIGKRFLPDGKSAWVGFAIMLVLLPLYKYASVTGATDTLQTIIDALTQLGELLFVGGALTVASSMAFNISKSHDNTIVGFERPATPNG